MSRRMRDRRGAVALTIVIAALTVGSRHVPADASAAPAASIPAAIVHLDVAATDRRGRAVDNLKPADFEVTVDGQPQPLESVKSVRIDPSAQSTDDNARPFAVFLDEFHTSRDGAERVRGPLLHFVDAEVRPHDVVAVMKPLDSLFSIAVDRNVTALRDAIQSFDGRRGDYTPRTAFEGTFMGRTPETVERQRRQVTVSALNALAVRLGASGDGRKAILFVSEGFAAPAPIRGEEMLPTVQSVVRNATRHNVAIYAIDPSAPSPQDAAVLQTLAADTDGDVMASTDELPAALRRIAHASSDYYLLTYQPSIPPDGRFHPVQVRVKRPGITIRTRKGFWAVPSEDALRAARAAEAAKVDIFETTPRHISPLINPWFGMSRAEDGRTVVTFVWEPKRRVPGDRSRVPSPNRVTIQARTADGATAYEGIVQPTGANVESRDAAAKAVFTVPPGRVQLHMSIAGENARELDFDSRDLAVRDLRQPVAIGTPAVLRARTALEFRTLAADPDAAPVAAREFSRAERLLVRFAAYAPPADALTISARLVNRAGQTLRMLAPAPVAGAPAVRQLDLPLASFAPGEYTIELAASTTAGGAKELVTFRITG